MINKGFTLIELLAVIIVLSIILLIAAPSFIDAIENAKQNSVKLSAKNYLDGLKSTLLQENLQHIYNPANCIIENGILTCGDKVLEFDIKGQAPSCGYVLLENGKLKESVLNIQGYKVHNKKGKTTIMKSTECWPTLENGEVIYFDVKEGKSCTVDEYNLSYDPEKKDYLNSSPGYNGYVNKDKDGNILEKMNGQNSCLKFFAYLSEDGAYANLLLDHDTSRASWKYFVGSSSLRNGPVDLLKNLYEDTKNWNGTILLDNYIYKWHKDNSPAYTITYNEIPSYEGAQTAYKARIITANEIARITANDDWDESLQQMGYYFETHTSSAGDACTDKDEKTECKYAWLYERLGTCKDYGCQVEGNYSSSYWTATGNGWDGSTTAWKIEWTGRKTWDYIDNKGGVRPVIKVLKVSIL